MGDESTTNGSRTKRLRQIVYDKWFTTKGLHQMVYEKWLTTKCLRYYYADEINAC